MILDYQVRKHKYVKYLTDHAFEIHRTIKPEVSLYFNYFLTTIISSKNYIFLHKIYEFFKVLLL